MFEKLLGLMSFNDIEDEDSYDGEEYEPETSRKSRKASTEYKSKKTQSMEEDDEGTDTRPSSQLEAARRERAAKYDKQAKVVPYKKDTITLSEVCVEKPKSYNDAEQICDLLISGKPVVVNFEGFNSFEAQRTMEFICGCLYALNGDMNQISKYIFIFAPYGVNIAGDFALEDGVVPTFDNNY